MRVCVCVCECGHSGGGQPTCPEGEEEALVGVLVQQGLDPPPHPLVPLVDQLQSEVLVQFLGRQLLAGQQRPVVEAGDLKVEPDPRVRNLGRRERDAGAPGRHE